jgi:hypothetical protein
VPPIRNSASHVGESAQTTYSTVDEFKSFPTVPQRSTKANQNQQFADILRRRPRRSVPGAPGEEKRREGQEGPESTRSDPPNLSQWFRAEVPADRPAVQAGRPAPRIAPHQRLLVSTGGVNPQARIEISGGSLAGSQIHLTTSGNRIEAQLLTGTEASRQTLVTAMDAVRERLRARGLIIAGGASTGFSDGRRQERQQDGRNQRSTSARGAGPRSPFVGSESERGDPGFGRGGA